MSYEGVGGGCMDEPELLQFATERYVEAEASAVDLETDGLTDLQLCAQYCRECTVSVQRMFHVRSLGRVCADALRVGAEPFPLDLLEDLAQDDDSEVRQSVAEQLGVLTNAIKISRRKQEDDLALGLLNVAFLLVEDDSDGVVAAAEDATATVATLCTTGEERAFLISRVEELCRCEEEEIRISGSKIAGELAEVLGAIGAARPTYAAAPDVPLAPRVCVLARNGAAADVCVWLSAAADDAPAPPLTLVIRADGGDRRQGPARGGFGIAAGADTRVEAPGTATLDTVLNALDERSSTGSIELRFHAR